MSKKETGGMAFPHDKYTKLEDGRWGTFASGGMTLRDYFAGQALVTLTETGMANRLEPAMVAKAAYEIADAMLEARK